MTYEEAKAHYEAECDEIAQQCQEEGYPSHGSNYSLRAEDAYRYWMGLVEDKEGDDKMLKWEKIKAGRGMEIVKCDRIKLDEGQKGSFVRYLGEDDVYFTFATSILSYESLAALEHWYIDGNNIYVKFPDARQHIGKIL